MSSKLKGCGVDVKGRKGFKSKRSMSHKRQCIGVVAKSCDSKEDLNNKAMMQRSHRRRRSEETVESIREYDNLWHIDSRSHESVEQRAERLRKSRRRETKRYHSEFVGLRQVSGGKCGMCGCEYLSSGSNSGFSGCCQRGRGQQFALEPLPDNIRLLMIDNTESYSRASSSYNNVFCLGATGIENNSTHGWERRRGDHSATLNGRTYHFLPVASDSTDPSGGLSYFTFDVRSSMIKHADLVNRSDSGRIYDTLKPDLLEVIYDDLCGANHLVRDVRCAGAGMEKIDLDDSDVVVDFIAKINEKMEFLEVGQITSDSETENRVVIYQLKGSKYYRSIPLTDHLLEPLCYPLLFCCGEYGWGVDDKKKLSYMDYLRCRMLMPEYVDKEHSELLCAMTKTGKLIPCNRFQVAARLGCCYLVDMMSRALDFRLEYVRRNQQSIFGGLPVPSKRDDDISGCEPETETNER
jgi:hypothetical protein